MKKLLFKTLLGVAATVLVATEAFAINGTDDSSNYPGGWTGNGGSGFGAWTFNSGNYGSGFAGAERAVPGGDANIQAADTSAWKLYAIDFVSTQQQEESVAYRGISAPLNTSGDSFSVSMQLQNGNAGIGDAGKVGFSLRNGNATGLSNEFAGFRLAVYLAGASNNVVVEDASGAFETTAPYTGPGSTYDFVVTLTGPNTYSLSITRYNGIGSTDAPVIVTGTLAGSGQIESFALFNWKNSAESDNRNSDAFFNKLAYSSTVCPTIDIGNITAYPLKNAAYSFTLAASGGAAPYTYAVTNGTLPAGLSLSSGGVLSGTPTTDGASTFTVKATDANGCTGSKTYALRVYKSGVDDSSNYASWSGNGGSGFGAWAFHTDNHGDGFTGAERNTGNGDANIQVSDTSIWKLYAINFSTSTQWLESIAYRAFSSPLQVSNDLFSVSMEMQNGNGGLGNPGQMGFALRNGNTTGSGNQSAGARLAVYLAGGSNNVVVADAAGAYETSVPNGGQGSAYDFTVRLTSGSTYELTITRYTNTAGATAAPVIITGTLAGSGTIDSFSLFNWKNSTNSNCNSDAFFNKVAYSSANFVCPGIVLKSLTGALLGTAYSNSVSASAGVPPYTYAVTSGALPTGLSLSSGGILTGTPTTAGASTFTVTATDANNCTGSRAYTFTVHGTGADVAENYGAWGDGANSGGGFGPWSIYHNYHGSGFAGAEKTSAAANIAGPNGQVWKMYAINFDSFLHQIEATAYRKFNVPLSVAGDEFTLSFQNGNIGNPGQVGFALRNGFITGANDSITNGSNNRAARARLQVYYAGGTGNLTVEDASGANQIAGTGFTSQGYDFKVTLTGPNTYSLSITRYNGVGTFDAPVVVTGTLAGSGPIDSFAMFTWKNSTDSGVNGDTYWSNLGYTAATPLITNNVTFQVDMTAQIYAGNFDPATGTVEVRGGFSNWVAGSTILTNNPALPGNASNIYSGIVAIGGAANSGESYKFVMNNPGATFEGSTPKLSTLDTGANDYNRFFQLPNTTGTVLPVVFFDDKTVNDFLPGPMSVTFSVNMNGAVLANGSNFVAGVDTVWINGEFIPWYAWYDPLNPTLGPAAYQLSDIGGGIYSVTVTIPKGKPVAFAYKYGVGVAASGDLGPRDNEAAAGQNHYRVIRSTATGSYTMPQDKFGAQYHEPLFSVAGKDDGQLTIGAPSGGTIPVRWLGRPGAHLQSANSLTGAWTDHLETDGTNWTSGVATTNGLMSITNWPAAGNTYFRLVKP